MEQDKEDKSPVLVGLNPVNPINPEIRVLFPIQDWDTNNALICWFFHAHDHEGHVVIKGSLAAPVIASFFETFDDLAGRFAA